MRQGMAVRAATGGMSLLSTAPDGRMNRSRRSVTARTDIPKRTDPRRGRSGATEALNVSAGSTEAGPEAPRLESQLRSEDRKSTRLNSSHQIISYAVFCLKKKNR